MNGAKASEGRRLRMLRVSSDVLLGMIAGSKDRWIRWHGLPDDARLADASYDPFTRDFLLAIESETFDPVTPSFAMPRLNVTASFYEGEELMRLTRPKEARTCRTCGSDPSKPPATYDEVFKAAVCAGRMTVNEALLAMGLKTHPGWDRTGRAAWDEAARTPVPGEAAE